MSIEVSLSRLVGCSGRDGSVRVWDLTQGAEASGKLKVRAVKAVWSPPEFGPLVATIDVEGRATIWHETDDWHPGAVLDDGRGPATDLEFGPGWFGLCLAVAREAVRIYECSRQWQLTAALACDGMISWRPFGKYPCLCVGARSGALKFWRRAPAADEWTLDRSLVVADDDEVVCDVSWCPDSRDDFCVAIATSRRVVLCTPERSQLLSPDFADLGAKSLKWNSTGRLLAVSGNDDVCRVFKLDFLGNWVQVNECLAPGSRRLPSPL